MNSDDGDPKFRDNVLFDEYITKLRLIIKSFDDLLNTKQLEFKEHPSFAKDFIPDINKSVDDFFSHYNLLKTEYSKHLNINSNSIIDANFVKDDILNGDLSDNIDSKIIPIKECLVNLERLNAEKYKEYIISYQKSKCNNFVNEKPKNRKLFTASKNKDSSKNKKIIELLDKDDVIFDDNKATMEVHEEDENFQKFLCTQIQSSLESQTTEIETDLIEYLIDEDEEIKMYDVSFADQDSISKSRQKNLEEFKIKKDTSYQFTASRAKRRRRVISSPSDDYSTPSSSSITHDDDPHDFPSSSSSPIARRQRLSHRRRMHQRRQASPPRPRHSQRLANLAPSTVAPARSSSSSSSSSDSNCPHTRRLRQGVPSTPVVSDTLPSTPKPEERAPNPPDSVCEAGVVVPPRRGFKRVCLVADISGDEERVAAKLGEIYQAIPTPSTPTPRDDERPDDDQGKVKKEGANEDGKDEKRVKSRKNIRKIKEGSQLAQETRDAAKAEQERLLRIKKNRRIKMNLLNEAITVESHALTELLLEAPIDGKGIRLEVDASIVKHLKPHQVKGIVFLYENLIESWARFQEGDLGGGAILAHLMGLGKTLQVITLVHTLLTSPHFGRGLKACLVICPQNTCMNWLAEIGKWTKGVSIPVKSWALHYAKSRKARSAILTEWKEAGGLLVVGYEMFRLMVVKSKSSSSGRNKRNGAYLTTIHESLQDPGPDILVCDEGHMLKNSSTAIFKAVNSVKTKRRIVLTGTPLQNNLYEYHCMVQLVRENILGSRFEFQNAFVNPIKNGQCADSTDQDVKIMKKRAHILHQKLAGCVQRMDYSSLTTPLTTKYEYVILVRLSPKQAEMYRHYLELLKVDPTPELHLAGGPIDNSTNHTNSNNKFSVFVDFFNLYSIITHPWLCHINEKKRERIRNSKLIWSDEEGFLDDVERSEQLSLESESEDSDRDTLVEIPTEESENEEHTTTDTTHIPGPKSKRVLRNRIATRKGDSLPKPPKEVQFHHAAPKGLPGDKDSDGLDQTSEVARPKDSRNINDDLTPSGKRMNSWWKSFLAEADANNVWLSGKIVMVLEILKEAESIGDKVLLFSQSLNTLDYLEELLAYIDKHATQDILDPAQVTTDASEQSRECDAPSHQILTQGWSYGTWNQGIDYFRMDGSTPITTRHRCTEAFNDVSDMRARFFLISTRAGSLGVNLIGASRVIIMDACWNPSHDTQSIFRAYRLGQEKPVFIYRLISQGTIEERIYERQVTKQSLSQRVVDKKQIERHFTFEDLDKLYDFDPKVFQVDRQTVPLSAETEAVQDGTTSTLPAQGSNRPAKHYPLPNVPKDHLLAQLLLRHGSWIVTYLDHDSLLENKISEELTEEERKLAWEEYENERRYGIGIAGSLASSMVATGSSFAGQPLPQPSFGPYMQRFAHLARASAPNPNLAQVPQSGSGITLGHPEFRVCGILIKDLMEMLHPNGRLNAEAIYKYILGREGTEDMVKFKDHVSQLMTMLKHNQTLIQNMVSYARTLESLKNPCATATEPSISRTVTQNRPVFSIPTSVPTSLMHPLFPNVPRTRQVGYRLPGPPKQTPTSITMTSNNHTNHNDYSFHQVIQQQPAAFNATSGFTNQNFIPFPPLNSYNVAGSYETNLTTSITRPSAYNPGPSSSLFRPVGTQASPKRASRGFRIIDGKAYPI